MGITSGFFNSISGDRTYNADQMTTYFEGLVSDGVYENIGDRFRVTTANSMAVNIGSGRALLRSRWVKNDAVLTMSIDAADVQFARYDAVVLRLDLTESGRDIDVAVIKGTPAPYPQVPNLTRTDDVYELLLAAVHVRKNANMILQSDIADMRSSSQCGWVTGLIDQVDTSDLFAQWQTAYSDYYAQSTAAFDSYLAEKTVAFNTWFDSLTATLNVDTSIAKYQNSVSVIGYTTEIAIGIEQYNADSDILMVYSNGVLMIENDEYTIGTNSITLARPFDGDNIVTFIVLKNNIGRSVIIAGEAVSICYGTANGISGHAAWIGE